TVGELDQDAGGVDDLVREYAGLPCRQPQYARGFGHAERVEVAGSRGGGGGGGGDPGGAVPGPAVAGSLNQPGDAGVGAAVPDPHRACVTVVDHQVVVGQIQQSSIDGQLVDHQR